MPAQLRVLLLMPSLRGGGAERVFTAIVRHLDRAAFDPQLAVIDGTGAVYRSELPADITLHDLESPRLRTAMGRLVTLIRRERPDVVLSTLGHVNLALAMLRPLLPRGIRLIGRETSMVSLLPLPGYERPPRAVMWAYSRFLRRLDAVVCQSEEMKADIVSHLGVEPSRARVIYNPVDVARVRALAAERDGETTTREEGTLHLLAAGSFQPRKGFDLLVDAVALCANPRLRLTILGDGPELPAVRTRAASRGVASQITFAGFNANPYPALSRADAFVLSSRFEGVPNVVLEALACRTPVVAMPAPGGVREVLAGVDGCVVADAVSAVALARAIAAFRPRRLAADAAARFDVSAIVPQYEGLLRDIVASRHA